MALKAMPIVAMITIIGLGVQVEARTPCQELPATAQRGHRGLETGDESTVIGALRSIISCLLSHRGDTQVRRQQSRSHATSLSKC